MLMGAWGRRRCDLKDVEAVLPQLPAAQFVWIQGQCDGKWGTQTSAAALQSLAWNSSPSRRDTPPFTRLDIARDFFYPALAMSALKQNLIGADDLFGQLDAKTGSSLWMGRYTEEDVKAALEKSGFLPALRAKGLCQVLLQIEPLDPFLQALKLYHREVTPKQLLAEFRVRETVLAPRRRLADGWGDQLPRVLAIEWLLLQNPNADFTPERPALPGQRHPGLGQARCVLKMLVQLAKRLELEAVTNFPQYYHNAILYQHDFHFYDPVHEGKLHALARDGRGRTLAEISWAIDLGCVETADGERFCWESDLQILPLSQRLVKYFASAAYRRQAEQARAAWRFAINENRLRALAPAVGGLPRSQPSTVAGHDHRSIGGEGHMPYSTIYEMLHHLSVQNGSKPAYRFKRDGRWQQVSWRENEARCRQIARSLMALGVKPGDKVNILSQSRLEWVQCDFGIVSCGGVTVGIYPSNLAPDCAYIFNHSDAEIIFVENQDQLAKISAVRAELPRLRYVILFDGPGNSAQQVLSWDEFLERSQAVSEAELEQRAAGIQPNDLASLVYTSGTTGVPKGVMLTQRNLIFTADSASQCLHLEGDMDTLMFLPLAHVFARLVIYFCLYTSKTVAFAESIEKVAENLQEIRPHFIASVPRIYEKIYTKVLANVQAAGGLKARLFYWALGVGTQVSQLQQRGQAIPAGLARKHRLANKLVLHKVQAAFGGRLQWAVSGAAPLNKSIAEFFHACGILILEGIGMTENTSFTNVNRFNHNKFGTVGPVGPGIEMKLAEDGEVLYRGPNVMAGYYKNPEATAEAIDPEGWLHTGDIGEIDEEGFLKITDRKKDLIITAGGKNVAPQRIERILRTSRYINQAVAVGDRQKFITALVTLNPEYVEPWARGQGIPFKSIDELVEHPKVQALIEAEVQQKNQQLASFESVKRVRIVPKDFTIAGGELTPTLKIKRKAVTEKYKKLLEEMYAE